MNGRDKENISNSSSFISLIYTNVDSLLNKMDELQNMCILAKPDIQSDLVNPTLFVSDSFTLDSKVSGLSNQLLYDRKLPC